MEENLNMKDHMGMIPVRMDSPWAMCVKEKRCRKHEDSRKHLTPQKFKQINTKIKIIQA
jgi:hypothetical protein